MVGGLRRLGQGTAAVLTVGLVLAGTVAILFVLNQIPHLLQREAPRELRRYETIAAAEAALHRSIALPAYFPDRLAWPPTRIIGQASPVPRLSLFFAFRDGEEKALIVHQMFGAGEPEPPLFPLVRSPQQRSRVVLGESHGELVAGEGDDGLFYRQLSWQVDSTRVVLLAQLSADELVRIAHSFLAP